MAKKKSGRKGWVMTPARKAYYASKKKGAKGTMASAQARAQATSYTKMKKDFSTKTSTPKTRAAALRKKRLGIFTKKKK